MKKELRCNKIRQVAYHRFRCIFAYGHEMPHVFQVYITIIQPLDLRKQEEIINSYVKVGDI